MLCAVLPEHFEEALEDTIQGKASQRALIKEIKVLLGILKMQEVKKALELVQTDPASLIPAERLRSCGLETVEQFATRSLNS